MKRSFALVLVLSMFAIIHTASAATTTLTLWRATGNLDLVIEAFEKAHPDIKVEYSAPSDYRSKLPVAASAGALPDVFMVDGPDVPAYHPFLLPLDRHIATSIVDDLMPVSREEGQWQGILYAVPVESNAQALVFNRDVLAENGIAEPDDSWTWRDLATLSRQMTIDVNGDGSPDRWGLHMPVEVGEGFAFWLYLPWIQQKGAEVLDENGTLVIDQTGTREAMSFMRQLFQEDGVIPLATTPWQHGEVGLAYRPATNLAGDLRAFPELNVGAVPFPKPEDGVYASGSGGWAIGINKDTQNLEAAIKFIQFWVSSESVALLATQSNLPAIAFRRSVMQSIITRDVEVPEGLTNFPYEGYGRSMEYGRTRTRTPHLPTVVRRVGPMFVEAFMGATPTNALLEQTVAQLRADLQQLASQ